MIAKAKTPAPERAAKSMSLGLPPVESIKASSRKSTPTITAIISTAMSNPLNRRRMLSFGRSFESGIACDYSSFYLPKPKRLGPLHQCQIFRESAGGRLWVNRVTLTACRSLPVYPCERTSSDRPGMSQTGQQWTHAPRQKQHRHSITSSAVANNGGGTVRPSALAVSVLITNLKHVGCSTGRSAGYAPFSILSA